MTLQILLHMNLSMFHTKLLDMLMKRGCNLLHGHRVCSLLMMERCSEPRGLSVDRRCVPFTSTATHEPTEIAHDLWARWKSLDAHSYNFVFSCRVKRQTVVRALLKRYKRFFVKSHSKLCRINKLCEYSQSNPHLVNLFTEEYIVLKLLLEWFYQERLNF